MHKPERRTSQLATEMQETTDATVRVSTRGGLCGRLAVIVPLVLLAAALVATPGCGKNGTGQGVPSSEFPAAVTPFDPGRMTPQFAAYLPQFIEAVEGDPGDFAAHAELGLVYEANEFNEEAIACFENAMRLAPNEPLPVLHLALVKGYAGDLEGKRELIRSLPEKFPEFAAGQHNMGVLALEDGEVEVAEAAFSKFIELKPDSPAGYVGLGDVYLRKRDFAAAAANLENALSINPRDGTARFMLGQAYRGLGRREDAERELAQTQGAGALVYLDEWTRRLPPHSKGLSRQVRRGITMLRYGNYEKAEEIFQTVLDWYPDNVAVYNNLAVAHARQNDLDLAIEILKRAEQLDPMHQETLSNLALFHHRTNMDREAVEYINRAVALAPNNTRFLRQQGSYLSRAGDLDGAVAAFEKAVELEPGSVANHKGLAETYRALDRNEEAKDEYLEILKLAPNDVKTHVALVDVYLLLGAEEDARKALDAVQRLAPSDPDVSELAGRF